MRRRRATTCPCSRQSGDLLGTRAGARERVLDREMLVANVSKARGRASAPCRFLLSPERNFFMRSTASPPGPGPALRFSLLFLRLVRVSTMKRVRELGASVSGKLQVCLEGSLHRIRLAWHLCMDDLDDALERSGVVLPQLCAGVWISRQQSTIQS